MYLCTLENIRKNANPNVLLNGGKLQLPNKEWRPKVALQVDYVENKFHAPVGQVVERVDKLENMAV